MDCGNNCKSIYVRFIFVAFLVFVLFFYVDVNFASAATVAVDVSVATSHPARGSEFYKDSDGSFKLQSRYFSDSAAVGLQYGSNSSYSSSLYFEDNSKIYQVFYEKDVPTRAYLLDNSLSSTYICNGKTYRASVINVYHSYATASDFRSYFTYSVPFFTKAISLVDGHDALMHKLFNLTDVSGFPSPDYPPGWGDGEYNKDIGYPLNFVYRFKGIGIPAKAYQHKVSWKNPVGVEDCTLQLQYKATYKVKKNVISKMETIEIDYFDVEQLDIYDLEYSIAADSFDLKPGGVVYQKISDKLGSKNFLFYSNGTVRSFRARYVKQDGDKFTYGNWVRCLTDGTGIVIPVVTDDKDNIVDTPDYPNVGVPDDPDAPTNIFDSIILSIRDFFQSINKLFDSLKKSVTSLISNISQAPTLFAKVLSFLPKEIWGLITIGIGIVIILRVLGR